MLHVGSRPVGLSFASKLVSEQEFITGWDDCRSFLTAQTTVVGKNSVKEDVDNSTFQQPVTLSQEALSECLAQEMKAFAGGSPSRSRGVHPRRQRMINRSVKLYPGTR